MSAKIGILAINQDIRTQPRTYVKRSVAELLVRRLLAEWIGRRMVRMLQTQAALKANELAPKRAYIPERMPPVDLPGIHFVDPRFPFRPIDLQP